jgi:hypothetical protein
LKLFSFHSKAVETYRDLLLCLGFFLEFDTCENEYNDALFYNRWQQHLTTIPIELGYMFIYQVSQLKGIRVTRRIVLTLLGKALCLAVLKKKFGNFFKILDLATLLIYWVALRLFCMLGFLWLFEPFKLNTCSLYHENLFIQKLQVISNQVLNNFFSASDIMEAVRGHFRFKWYEYYLTTLFFRNSKSVHFIMNI